MKKLAKKRLHLRLSLAQKIILSMASMVLLTLVASGILFYFVFTSQVNDFTRRLDAARQVSLQSNTIKNDDEIVSQIRLAVNSKASSDQILDEVRRSLSINRDVNATVIKKALQQQGWISGRPDAPFPFNFLGRGFGPPTPQTINSNQLLSDFIFNPIANSIWAGVALAAIIAVILGFFLARGIVNPLRKLEQASDQLADGNYNLEIRQSGDSDLARLASSFNRMAIALRLTEQKRKDLLADMSHEFRTPLSSIQGYTEVLRDGLIADPKHQNELYDHILKEVKHLTAMVNSMRAWVRNEQELEHLAVTEVETAPIAQEIVRRFQPTAEEKHIKLELNLAATAQQVSADEDALLHILSNLVDNALRYTPAEGTVRLKIGYTPVAEPSSSRQVWFEVLDTGVGIAAEHLPFVFERFYRVDKSRSRHTGGTGLGLAIVRDTVQTLGGEVKISSEPGKGTSVTFWLPSVKASLSHRKLIPLLSHA